MEEELFAKARPGEKDVGWAGVFEFGAAVCLGGVFVVVGAAAGAARPLVGL